MAPVTTRHAAGARTRAAAGTIALTFDDGPDPVWTPLVLAELERHEAVATFFVEARRALAQTDLIVAMREAGHEVGFHCFDHVRHADLDEQGVRAEVAAGLTMLDSLGVRPATWRAPWGVVTEATRRVATERDLELWNWSFDSHDWRGDGCEEMLAALSETGGLVDGTVALMHDALGPGARRDGCLETVRLTGRLLEAASAAGLRPVPLSAAGAAEAP
jgi:peptidoglycan/xylan/chitin deacetylase (PgdA/CDA1 family)